MDIDPPFCALVTGGRDYHDSDAVFRALDSLHRKHPNITVLTSNCPTGADALARRWAVMTERPYISIPTQWGIQRMLCYLPHGVVAFPGGAETADCVSQAEAAGVLVWRP